MSPSQIITTSITIVCLLLFNSTSKAQGADESKHTEVSLRMIGHQVLLNSGDSYTRVLPIIKENGQYRIQFESEFGFNPNELVNTVNRVILDTKLAKGYFIEVEHCETGEVVYSYEMGDLENIDVIPCKSRDQPKSCYSLLLTLIKSKSTSSSTNATSVKGSQSENNRLYIIIGSLFAFLLLGFILLLKGRRKSNINRHLIQVGNYYFDKHNTALILKEKRIELTSKEADLLMVLYNAVNETVERDIILNVVWGDEGDYVGRTLDVFVSKLRKKLEGDSSVKIVNIRGIGYKLVVDI